MIITTAAELVEFRDSVNSGRTYEGRTIILGDNIDLSSKCSPENEISWLPIGGWNNSEEWWFMGTFDGNNKTISNLYINNITDAAQSLFRRYKK